MKSILVVDDAPGIRRILSHLLEKDYRVLTACDGKQAVEMVIEHHPDLILMDISMPVMDGLTAVQQIRFYQGSHRIPILMLSCIDQKEDQVRSLEAGANDFVQKPFCHEELMARIETHLEVAELNRQLEDANQKLSASNKHLERERKMARRVLNRLLPQQFDVPSLEVGVFYQGSDDIGGDFYDVWQQDGLIHVMMGDVSTIGMASGVLMASWRSLLRTLSKTHLELQALVEQANIEVCHTTQAHNAFLTLTYVIIDTESQQLQMISAGHEPSFLKTSDGIQRIESGAIPLGMSLSYPWKSETYSCTAGDLLVLHTDGFSGTLDENGSAFGTEMIESILEQEGSVEELTSTVQEAFKEHAQKPLKDDASFLLLQLTG